MIWTLVFIGAVAAATLLGKPAGIAIGAALGYLLGRLLKLETEVARLRDELRAQQRSNVQPTAAASSQAPTSAPTPSHAAHTSIDSHAAAVDFATAPVVAPETLPTSGWAPSPHTAEAESPWQTPVAPATDVTTTSNPSWPPPPTSGVLAPWLARALDWLRGGNPLARVGIVILFFGGAFLAKYAAEHSHFPLELRMAALAGGALVLLAIGWRLRESRAAYAQTLQGGGVAGFYLTVFAATRLYHLLPDTTALTLLLLIATVAAVLAVAQDALALAVIGTAGGFMAPILLSTDSGNHVALFSYYTVLNLGVFAVAWFRAWRVLNLVGFVFTFGIVGLFRATSYSLDKIVSADGFLLLYFLLYVGITVLFALRQKPQLKHYVSSSLVFGLPLATFAIHGSMIERFDYGLAWSALGFGAFYLTLAITLRSTRRDNFELLAEAFAALGIIFLSLAIPMAFDHRTTAASWAVEGAGLVWIGMRQQRWLARGFGLLLQLLGGAVFLLDHHHLVDGPALFNRMTLGSAMLAIAGLLSAYWFYRSRENARSWEHRWEPLAALWGIAWWIDGGFSEVLRVLPQYELGADLTLLAVSAIALWLLGERLAWPLARRMALALLPAAAAIGIAGDASHPLVQAAALGWPLVFVVHYGLLRLSERDDDALITRLRPWLHAGAFWLLGFVVAWELHWQLVQQVPGVWRELPWGLAPALLLFLCARAALWPGWPLRQHAQTYRHWVAPLLAAWAATWLLDINLHSDGDPGYARYLPLLNPLDIASALTLASIAIWWRELEPEAALRRWLQPALLPAAVFAALAFVWLNAALIRALHYGMDTPLSLDGIAHSIVVQAALSIFWSLLGFGAMIGAAQRQQRAPWMAGAVLMAVVVVKLFLVDTSGSGTLARIAAFLSVGALLLLTGYLSPLPPRSDGEKEPAP